MLALLVPLGAAVGSGTFAPFWKSPIVRDLVTSPPDFKTSFLWLASMMFALALLKNVIIFANHTVMGRLRTRSVDRLGNLLFARYLSFGKAYFDRMNPGQLTAVLEYRHDVLHVFHTFIRISGTSLILCAYFVVMLLISWRLTLIALLLFPVVHFGTRSLLRKATAASRTAKQATLEISKHAHQVVSLIPLYQSSAQEEQAKSTFASIGSEFLQASRHVWQLQGLSLRIQEITALLALLLMLGLTMVAERERASQPAVLLVFFFVARLSLPLLALIPELLHETVERIPRAREVLAVFDDSDKFIVTDGNRPFPGLKKDITFDRLTFAYSTGPTVLNDLTFHARRGQLTAIVGPTGAGKSTIFQLLQRFYEYNQGSIRIDGVDLREFSASTLRRAFALVSQDVLLIPDTLRANLVFGCSREVSDSELSEAIRSARLEDVVNSIGLDAVLGERGATLSGGQRQRVAIARALLRKAPILLLDEATSGLDAITEQLVQQAIDNALQNATALVIAHRFSTIQRADHVVVLEAGRVVEHGPVPELLAKRGLFYKTWQQQEFGATPAPPPGDPHPGNC